jgi:hypothetical protein
MCLFLAVTSTLLSMSFLVRVLTYSIYFNFFSLYFFRQKPRIRNLIRIRNLKNAEYGSALNLSGSEKILFILVSFFFCIQDPVESLPTGELRCIICSVKMNSRECANAHIMGTPVYSTISNLPVVRVLLVGYWYRILRYWYCVLLVPCTTGTVYYWYRVLLVLCTTGTVYYWYRVPLVQCTILVPCTTGTVYYWYCVLLLPCTTGTVY